jgi:iron complex outermembrane receptor protein
MRGKRFFSGFLILSFIICGIPAASLAQTTGSIRGVITLDSNNSPLHQVSVSIVQLKRGVETDDQGAYEFRNVPPGKYSILAHLEGFPDDVRTVDVTAGSAITLDFQLRISGLKEQITVTASGSEQSTFEAFQAVTTLDPSKILEESHPSLGEVLDKEPGVAKRSEGPGSSRPVIRGFDGDRVLVMQDGVRSGSLGSQSGDHGEPIDVLSLERLEVVKGPATLLYGSNAIGGVVNAITGHDFAHTGVRGYFSGIAGTTNAQGGVSGGLEYGIGKWLLWGNGTGQRTGNYDTPIGEILNSQSRVASGQGGFGWFGDKAYGSLSYGYNNNRYGVPFDPSDEESERAIIALRRHDFKFNGGLRDMGRFIDAINLTLDYSDYQHQEIPDNIVATTFKNKQFVYRGFFDQQKRGILSGRFGFWGMTRDYKAIGEESLAPPTNQNSIAGFVLEELNFERVSFQLGGRVENNSYDPDGLTNRSFTGFSGAAGMRVPLWKGGAFVANYTHSYRAPALEELYNFGPHEGNKAFEIGDPNLKREASDGLDLSLRHSTARLRGEANFYYYNISDFVFLAPTGAIEDGLLVANYSQADSRFLGTELDLGIRLHHNVWLNTGLDYVDAELKATGTPLPRIPPLRGRIGFDFNYRGLSVRPEAVMAKDQDQLFPTETRTAGYTLFNVVASYAIPRQHYANIISVNAFNLGNRLYRNHLSFLKEFAPEIGRGVRVSYTVRFF